jgi:uncharacterized protein (TIGR00255 family)
MTGFARVREQTRFGELTVSLRTVNHRSLDFHFHGGSEFLIFENAVRSLLKSYVSRGHLELRLSLAPSLEHAPADYNRDVVARYVAAFREAARDFGIVDNPDLNAALRLPGVFASANGNVELDSSFEPELLSVVEHCAGELNAFRAREGAELTALFEQAAAVIQASTREMREIRNSAIAQFHARLQERLASVLTEANLDPRRLAEEVAILADKSDVEEELSRLEIHTGQLLEMFRFGGDVGKKIDFLLQEMNRETNTILSKTSGIGDIGLTMTHLGLAVKAGIERIREQALNVE